MEKAGRSEEFRLEPEVELLKEVVCEMTPLEAAEIIWQSAVVEIEGGQVRKGPGLCLSLRAHHGNVAWRTDRCARELGPITVHHAADGTPYTQALAVRQRNGDLPFKGVFVH